MRRTAANGGPDVRGPRSANRRVGTKRASRVAAAIGFALALAGTGVGCTLVAGVGDYAVGDAGGSQRGEASVDAKRDDAPTRHDAKGGEDAPASRDAGVDVAPRTDANAPAACGILDAGTPLDLCTEAGAPALLTTFTSGAPVVAIVTDDVSVYWSDGATIWSCPVGGCGTPMMLYPAIPSENDAGPVDVISDIAVDKTYLFFAGVPSGTAISNVSGCFKANGCTATGGFTYGSAQNRATSVASDNTNVFWTDDAGLHTCPVGGCADSGTNNIATGNPAAGPLALGSSYVDWVDVHLGKIVHTAKQDSLTTVTPPLNPYVSESFVPATPGNSQLVTTAVGLYWASPFALNLCPTDALQSAATCLGGAVRVGPVFAAPPSECSAKSTKNIPIATDDTNVYYVAPVAEGASCFGGAALVKCTPQGVCTVLSSALPAGIRAIVADEKNVYWAQLYNDVPSVMFIPHS